MQKLKKNWIWLVLLLVGLGCILYPAISSRINGMHQTTVVEDYQTSISTMPDETLEKIRQSAMQFNGALYGETGGAFGKISQALDDRYWNELDPDGNGVMGYLNIPVIGQTLPIEHGTSNETLQNAAGHVESSSLPVGGETTHVVLSGHRGLPSSVLFTNLDILKIGDKVYLHILGGTLAYEVSSIETVLPEQTESLAIREGEDQLTLITCTPYGINSHRLLVHAKRIPYVVEQEEQTKNAIPVTSTYSTLILVIIGVIIGILIIIFVPRYYKRRAEKRYAAKKEK